MELFYVNFTLEDLKAGMSEPRRLLSEHHEIFTFPSLRNKTQQQSSTINNHNQSNEL